MDFKNILKKTRNGGNGASALPSSGCANSWAKIPMRDRTTPILKHNHTFLVCFGGMSGEFGPAMVRILVRLSPYAVVRSR